MDVKPQQKTKFGINETSGDIYALVPLDRDKKTGDFMIIFVSTK